MTDPPPRAAARPYPWPCLAFVVVAYAVALHQPEAQSIWFDEGWSAFAATRETLLAAALADPTNPPLYYMLLNLSTRAVGDSEFALRWFSAAWGLLAIPLAFQLAGRLAGPRAGLWTAFLVTVSPLMAWAGREARMYTLLAVLVLVAALAWHRLRARPVPSAWAALLGAELGLMFAHNTGPVAALWLNAVTVIGWAVDRRRGREDHPGGPQPFRPAPRAWFAGQLAVAALWAPYFIARYTALAAANQTIASTSTPDLAFFSRVWQVLWTGPWLMVGQEPVVVGLAAVILVLAVVATPWRQAGGRWMLVHAALLVGGMLLGLGILQNEFHGRYLVMAAPLLLAAIGIGLAGIELPRLRWLAAGVFALNAAVAGYLATTVPGYGHDDARAMVRNYADRLDERATVLAWSYADRYDLAYYWDRLGVRARRVTLPENADLDAILPLLPTSGDVAVNVWFAQRADYRGMLSCVLGNGTTNLPETWRVPGMHSLVYRAIHLDPPEMVLADGRTVPPIPSQPAPPVGRFDGVDLSAVGSLPEGPGDQARCLPVAITLTPAGAQRQAGAPELQAAAVVLAPDGREIAHVDAVFAGADQRTSVDAPEGTRLTAYPLVRLPVGTPPGDYDLRLRVFDAGKPEGYDVLGGDGERIGKDFDLGTWRVTPGAVWARTGRVPDRTDRTSIVPAGPDLARIVSDEQPIVPQSVVAGEDLALTLLWQGRGPLPALELRADDGSWQVDVPAPVPGPRDDFVRDWRKARIPADAPAGPAVLRMADGTPIARFRVDALPPAEHSPPPYAIEVGAEIEGLGTLTGATLPRAAVDRGSPVPVTLVWRAGAVPPPHDLVVSVQLLDSAGRLIAQHDGAPVGGARPTTGWRPGEVLVDNHALTFLPEAAAGRATLQVVVYDPATGERMRVAGGRDAVRVPGAVDVR
jgi:4-amino-4-deoxy-L-arabinose transferase-like glycosyltransferase